MFKDKLSTYYKTQIEKLRDEIASLEKEKLDLERDNKQLRKTIELMKRLQDETLNQYQTDMEEMRQISLAVRDLIQSSISEKKELEDKVQSLTQQLDDIGNNVINKSDKQNTETQD